VVIHSQKSSTKRPGKRSRSPETPSTAETPDAKRPPPKPLTDGSPLSAFALEEENTPLAETYMRKVLMSLAQKRNVTGLSKDPSLQELCDKFPPSVVAPLRDLSLRFAKQDVATIGRQDAGPLSFSEFTHLRSLSGKQLSERREQMTERHVRVRWARRIRQIALISGTVTLGAKPASLGPVEWSDSLTPADRARVGTFCRHIVTCPVAIPGSRAAASGTPCACEVKGVPCITVRRYLALAGRLDLANMTSNPNLDVRKSVADALIVTSSSNSSSDGSLDASEEAATALLQMQREAKQVVELAASTALSVLCAEENRLERELEAVNGMLSRVGTTQLTDPAFLPLDDLHLPDPRDIGLEMGWCWGNESLCVENPLMQNTLFAAVCRPWAVPEYVPPALKRGSSAWCIWDAISRQAGRIGPIDQEHPGVWDD
jgi:hypothetical protein